MRAIGSSLALACLFLVSACGGNGAPAARQPGSDDTALPKPESTAGSVTGMPDKPGPGPVGAAVHADDTSTADGQRPGDGSPGLPPGNDPGLPDADGGMPPSTSDAVLPPTEPTVDDAVAVLRDYYAAIDAGHYQAAYALWSGAGAASGRTWGQFGNGFADTASVEAAIGAPGRVDAAAGSRYVEVPVTVTATQRDGSIHHYAGTYVLRRAVVDGASADQRSWRIASADIREVAP